MVFPIVVFASLLLVFTITSTYVWQGKLTDATQEDTINCAATLHHADFRYLVGGRPE